jgi:hypothetical protein
MSQSDTVEKVGVSPWSGTAFLNAQERVTNQSVVLALNRQF